MQKWKKIFFSLFLASFFLGVQRKEEIWWHSLVFMSDVRITSFLLSSIDISYSLISDIPGAASIKREQQLIFMPRVLSLSYMRGKCLQEIAWDKKKRGAINWVILFHGRQWINWTEEFFLFCFCFYNDFIMRYRRDPRKSMAVTH